MQIYGGIFDFEGNQEKLIEIKRELEDPTLWNNPSNAQHFTKEHARLKELVEAIQSLEVGLQEGAALLEIVQTEQDKDAFILTQQEIEKWEKVVQDLEKRRMFPHETDPNNAYLDLQSGSGGTEAQDWAEMLLRMYTRWGEAHGHTVDLIDISPGEVAGIKSATLKIIGRYTYGWLRTETGVHRLVRKSPFDSGNRRHTSFAAIFVYPEVSDEIEVNINPADLRIDTYRASGAGGQHVNRTDSAVRITHLPTHIVVQCQNDRSQHKNKAEAMSQLKAKLYELELQKREQEKKLQEESKSDIEWGHQIRSYILDKSLIKDHRTKVEVGNTQAVLNGDLDKFLEASLKMGL